MSTPIRILVAACLLAAAFAAGWRLKQPSGEAGTSTAQAAMRWECPMHPQYTSDHAGDCPICGMRLVPVREGAGSGGTQARPPAGAVTISLAQQQLIGVLTEEVKRAPASQLLRVPGRITVDESRLFLLVAAADGWIRQLGDNSAGTYVKKDEMLASYYTLNFLTAQQNLLYALRTADPLRKADIMLYRQIDPTVLNVQTSIDTLRSLGMSDLQLEELQQKKTFMPEIHVYSPITGYVVARNISPGQQFGKGVEFFRIADISHLWVMTDLFEKDRAFVKPGVLATVRYQGRSYQARMSDVLPQFDPQSRTLKTRFEVDNRDNALRPDMFVDVELHVTMPAALTVPADAIVDTGQSKRVFVDAGGGTFAPRVVEAGWRLGDRVEITSGLAPGEHVVVSGNFLIDSESRMRLTAPVMDGHAGSPKAGAEIDPVCGMEVDPAQAGGLKSEYGGKTYYFCMDDCKRKFDRDPQSYLKAPGSKPHD